MNTFVLFCFVSLCWSPVLLFAIGLINWYSHRNDPVKNSALIGLNLTPKRRYSQWI